MPHVARNTGLLPFALLLLIFASLADLALYLLLLVVDRVALREEAKYHNIARALFGRPVEIAAAVVVILQQLGACTSYVVIMADVLTPMLGIASDPDALLCKRVFLQLVVVGAIVFPLCMLRKMDHLKFTSTLALIFMLAFAAYLLFTGAYFAAHSDEREDFVMAEGEYAGGSAAHKDRGCGASHDHVDAPGSTVHLFRPLNEDFLSGLPILAFSYLFHQNAFPVYSELKDRSVRRMSIVGHWSLLICSLVYGMAGMMGYVTFLNSVDANVLVNFATHGHVFYIIADVLRVGFGFAIIFSYPVVVWEARAGIDELLFPGKAYSIVRYFLLNLVIIGLTTGIAIRFPSIDVVLGYVGSTCSPTMVYVLPAVFYLRAFPEEGWTRTRISAVALLVLAIVLIPLALVMTALSHHKD